MMRTFLCYLRDRMFWLAPVFMGLICSVVFLPALSTGFLWDDIGIVSKIVDHPGWGWASLRWFWTTFYIGHYAPLSWMSWALDYYLWGLSPAGFHLTNLVLHTLNAVLFYGVSSQLIGLAFKERKNDAVILLASGCAAVLFAVHPLRVETVVWITERRGLLAGFFVLLSLYVYLKSFVAGAGVLKRRWQALPLFLFALSLLSKASAMAFPLVLLLLDFYPLQRVKRWYGRGEGEGISFVDSLREKAPFLLLSFVFACIGALAQSQAQAAFSIEGHGYGERFLQIVFGIVFYFKKTLAPHGLVPLYELSIFSNIYDSLWVLNALFVLGVTCLVLYSYRRWPAGIVVWFSYLGLLFPTLGFFQSGRQIVADRYSYLACMVWAVLAGGGIVAVRDMIKRLSRRVVLEGALWAVVLSVAAGLGIATWHQQQHWQSNELLWARVLEAGPDSGVAHLNMGHEMIIQSRLDEACDHYQKALSINPLLDEAMFHMGYALSLMGKKKKGAEYYRKTIWVNPNHYQAYNNFGQFLLKEGLTEQAIWHFQKALDIQPDSELIQRNLTSALSKRK